MNPFPCRCVKLITGRRNLPSVCLPINLKFLFFGDACADAPSFLSPINQTTQSDDDLAFPGSLHQNLGHSATLRTPHQSLPKAAFRYLSISLTSDPNLSSATMSSAVDNLADNLANASVTDSNAAIHDSVLASAAEGRRLYIGNLAYATTEGELKAFFSGYDV